MIDFSTAPEGATHYREVEGVQWWKTTILDLYVWSPVAGWVHARPGGTKLIKIPSVSPQCRCFQVECINKREQMLCEQVLRLCRGEESEGHYGLSDLDGGKWKPLLSNVDAVNINYYYRAKPKKELVVPWEWIDEQYTVCVVDLGGSVGFKYHQDSASTHMGQAIKLDLEGIELPVTVHRPTENGDK